MYVAGRERRCIEAGVVFVLQVVLYDVHVVGREHRHLEAEVFSLCGGLVWCVRRRA